MTDPTTEPLYAATVATHGWSPEELAPPFDLRAVITASYDGAKKMAHPRPRRQGHPETGMVLKKRAPRKTTTKRTRR